jgi:toxin YoeB
MRLVWASEAWDDCVWWQGEDKKTVKRINKLIKDIERHGHDGIGKPEPLKYEFSRWRSRRIDDINRLVYRITGDAIEIMQCRYHYGA